MGSSTAAAAVYGVLVLYCEAPVCSDTVQVRSLVHTSVGEYDPDMHVACAVYGDERLRCRIDLAYGSRRASAKQCQRMAPLFSPTVLEHVLSIDHNASIDTEFTCCGLGYGERKINGPGRRFQVQSSDVPTTSIGAAKALEHCSETYIESPT